MILNGTVPGPFTFLSCDNFISKIDYENAISRLQKSDLIVWTAPEYPMSKYKTNRYSWVNVNNNMVTGFPLKNLPDGFTNPSMIVGNFTSKNKELARKLIRECFKTAEKYNSEIYLVSVNQIALEFGHKVSLVGLDKFFAVGTEDGLNIYKYYSNFKISKFFICTYMLTITVKSILLS